jgi:aspartate racemase
MKKIGVIGGVGPESTIVYYKLIIEKFRKKFNTKDTPSLLINSINVMHMAGLIANNQIKPLIEFLTLELRTLEHAGVTHGAISANTPHLVFDEVQAQTPIKLVSIVEETCKFVKSNGTTRVLLLGTKATMSAGFYNKVAVKYNLEVITPDPDQQEYIHEKYLNELLFNDIRPDTKKELISIVRKVQINSNVQGLILGGTELPLILSTSDFDDLHVYDSAAIHTDAIVNLF